MTCLDIDLRKVGSTIRICAASKLSYSPNTIHTKILCTCIDICMYMYLRGLNLCIMQFRTGIFNELAHESEWLYICTSNRAVIWSCCGVVYKHKVRICLAFVWFSFIQYLKLIHHVFWGSICVTMFWTSGDALTITPGI